MKRTSLFCLGLCLLFATLLTSLPASAKGDVFSDKTLKGEVKKFCPLQIEDPIHGQLRLNHDGSFSIANKSRFNVGGGWDVKNGKLVLKWTDSEDTLSLPVRKEKDGLRIDGKAKDKTTGKFSISGTSSNDDAPAATEETPAE